jgi:hypothetical protein
MEKYFILIFMVQIVNCNQVIDWLKNVSDPSFVCPSSEQEITKSLKIQFFSIVDCDEKDSRWDYDFQVNKNILEI